MFRSCFVARVAVEKSRAVELFCTFDDPQQVKSSGNGLPPAQALGGFCFPLGPDNVKPKEYMAPEVPAHSVQLDQLPSEMGGVTQLVVCLQEYSFTLTVGDGSRLHGFCRQDCAFAFPSNHFTAVYSQPEQCAEAFCLRGLLQH